MSNIVFTFLPQIKTSIAPFEKPSLGLTQKTSKPKLREIGLITFGYYAYQQI